MLISNTYNRLRTLFCNDNIYSFMYKSSDKQGHDTQQALEQCPQQFIALIAHISWESETDPQGKS